MNRAVIILIAVLNPAVALGQPTEFYTCLDDTNFCVDAPLDTMALAPRFSCGETFYRFAGRLALPALRNIGPVTISVKTMGQSPTLKRFPLYVEIRYRDPQYPLGCEPFLAGALVMIAQGIPVQCGGVWESVTVDLPRIGFPLNEPYHVQVVGLRWLGQYDSPGLACVRVTTEGPMAAITSTWSLVKRFYR